MSDTTKTKLLQAVEMLAPDNKSALYLELKEVMERHSQKKDSDSWLESAKPQLRIHKNLEPCEACSA